MVNGSIYMIAYALLGCSSINTVNASAMASICKRFYLLTETYMSQLCI